MEQVKDLLVLIAMLSCVGGIFYLLSQLGLRTAIKKLEARDAPDLNQFFEPEIAAKNPLLIYFHSNTCPACDQVTPIIDKLRLDHDNVVKVNCSETKDAARAFSIFGTPTVLQINDGKVGKIIVGRVREKVLIDLIGPPAAPAAASSDS